MKMYEEVLFHFSTDDLTTAAWCSIKFSLKSSCLVDRDYKILWRFLQYLSKLKIFEDLAKTFNLSLNIFDFERRKIFKNFTKIF